MYYKPRAVANTHNAPTVALRCGVLLGMGQTDARKKRKLGEATSAPQSTTESQQPAPQNTTSPAPHTTSHNKKSNNSAKKKRKKRTGGAAEEESQLPDGSSFKIDGATATPEQLSLRIR